MIILLYEPMIIILLQIMFPFVLVFEKRNPQAGELIIISVMCAIAVAGRTAFFMLPQFKTCCSYSNYFRSCFWRGSWLSCGCCYRLGFKYVFWAGALDPLADVCFWNNWFFLRESFFAKVF